jgi:hypothetical protein
MHHQNSMRQRKVYEFVDSMEEERVLLKMYVFWSAIKRNILLMVLSVLVVLRWITRLGIDNLFSTAEINKQLRKLSRLCQEFGTEKAYWH